MAIERVLDIGIGRGGDYINHDLNGVKRVGLDINYTPIYLLRDERSMDLCQADAEITENKSLPFASRSFDRIDIILPHDELLYALTMDGQGLWNEMYRVTKEDTQIKIVVDVPFMGLQGVFIHEEPIIISMPHVRIVEKAMASGFKPLGAVLQQMTAEEMLALGTQHSKPLVGWMKATETKAYRITVAK